MATFTSDAEIESIAMGFIDRSLPKSAWTHSAHFATALWLLRRDGLRAMHEMPQLIMAYNEATGGENTDTSGYHETITVASLRAAHAWLLPRHGVPLHVVHGELLATAFGRSDWLLTYWSKPRLFSVEARRAWVDPDLAPLPF